MRKIMVMMLAIVMIVTVNESNALYWHVSLLHQ